MSREVEEKVWEALKSVKFPGMSRDIVSFGGVDCSTRICVRDTAYVQPAGEGAALGYCSMPCGACPQGMTCRPLLLDEQTLAAIKAADPERYRRLFGETTTPYFCIRGGG